MSRTLRFSPAVFQENLGRAHLAINFQKVKVICRRLVMNKQIIGWEVAGVFTMLILGSMLHFAFELSGFWKPVALIASVNESTWEHLKMVFWPGLFFFVAQYLFLKNTPCGKRFWTAKAVCLLLMPLIIAVGWYAAVALLGENVFSVNIALFVGAVLIGQLVSYAILSGKISGKINQKGSIIIILLLTFAFATLTYFPPQMFLFEHMDLENTGQYGILEGYEGLLIFDRR